jgi:hypothetical protein
MNAGSAEPIIRPVAEARGQLLGLAHHLFHRITIRIEPVGYLQDPYTTGKS